VWVSASGAAGKQSAQDRPFKDFSREMQNLVLTPRQAALIMQKCLPSTA